MKKMGRPKLDNPRNRTLSFRVREDVYARIHEYVAKHDLTITELVEQATGEYMKKHVKPV